jgi:hypothetical protein
MQMEENAGLGLGLVVLLAISVVAAALTRRRAVANTSRSSAEAIWLQGVRIAPFVAVAALLTQSNVAPLARILAPYYPLLFPALLVGSGHGVVVRRRWWRRVAYVVFTVAGVLLIISPARPLFPLSMVLTRDYPATSPPYLDQRVQRVYCIYRDRPDAFAPARAALPPDAEVLGLVTYDDPETSLWRPFGHRRIVHVCPEDTTAQMKERGIRYILVKEELFNVWFQCSLEDWLKRIDARIVQKIPLNLKAATGPQDWYLVQLQ